MLDGALVVTLWTCYGALQIVVLLLLLLLFLLLLLRRQNQILVSQRLPKAAQLALLRPMWQHWDLNTAYATRNQSYEVSFRRNFKGAETTARLMKLCDCASALVIFRTIRRTAHNLSMQLRII